MATSKRWRLTWRPARPAPPARCSRRWTTSARWWRCGLPAGPRAGDRSTGDGRGGVQAWVVSVSPPEPRLVDRFGIAFILIPAGTFQMGSSMGTMMKSRAYRAPQSAVLSGDISSDTAPGRPSWEQSQPFSGSGASGGTGVLGQSAGVHP